MINKKYFSNFPPCSVTKDAPKGITFIMVQNLLTTPITEHHIEPTIIQTYTTIVVSIISKFSILSKAKYSSKINNNHDVSVALEMQQKRENNRFTGSWTHLI